jgi:hypothetical protein
MFSEIFLADSTLLGFIGLGFFTCALVVWVIRLELRLRSLMRGARGKNLEGTIHSLQKHADECASFRTETVRSFKYLERGFHRSVQGIATVRFDAFSGNNIGGRQSFATALVSPDGDGVVLSSLHARERTRMYAKPLEKFSSENELTDEERRAIAEARKKSTIS